MYRGVGRVGVGIMECGLFQRYQRHVFDAHDVELHESLRLSSECLRVLIMDPLRDVHCRPTGLGLEMCMGV